MAFSYAEFADLKMRDFWPKDARIWTVSGTECHIGYGDGEAVGFCCFLGPTGHPEDVSEVRLEAFGEGQCRVDVGNALLARIGIPLSVGVSLDVAVGAMGEPVEPFDEIERRIYAHWTIGSHWRYEVFALFSAKDELASAIIVRGDAYRRAKFGKRKE